MSTFSFYKQPDAMDCGPTCLRMIAKYYGRTVSLQKLRKLSETIREGSSLHHLSTTAEQLGFRTLGVKISFQKLAAEAELGPKTKRTVKKSYPYDKMVVRLGLEPRVFWTKTRRVAFTPPDNRINQRYMDPYTGY